MTSQQGISKRSPGKLLAEPQLLTVLHVHPLRAGVRIALKVPVEFVYIWTNGRSLLWVPRRVA